MPPSLALIFDVDGTIADTERDGHRVAFNRAFAAAGVDWQWTVAQYGELLCVAGGKERLRRYLAGGASAPAGGDPETLIGELHAAKNRIYEEMLREGRIDLRPGIRRLIEEARGAGVPLAIATTSARSNVEALLHSVLRRDAARLFEVIATADEVDDKKPSPAVYEYVLERLGVARGRCIVFEDSENGLRAAHGAGLATIITVNDYTAAGDYRGAELVVDQLGEPERPLRVLGGEWAGRLPPGVRCVDLALLRRMLADV